MEEGPEPQEWGERAAEEHHHGAGGHETKHPDMVTSAVTAAILAVLDGAGHGDGRPTVIIAHTIKGKGVSFMEGHYYWHTRIITPEELATAMADLGEPFESKREPR